MSSRVRRSGYGFRLFLIVSAGVDLTLLATGWPRGRAVHSPLPQRNENPFGGIVRRAVDE